MAGASIQFGLNHMIAPNLSLEGLFTMAKALGVSGVEIRNDIEGKPISRRNHAGGGSRPCRHPRRSDHLDQRAATLQRMERCAR